MIPTDELQRIKDRLTTLEQATIRLSELLERMSQIQGSMIQSLTTLLNKLGGTPTTKEREG